MSTSSGRTIPVMFGVGLVFCAASLSVGCGLLPATGGQDSRTHLQRAKVYLAAGDYRRAVEACQQEVAAHPSAEAYTYLTYVYQALDAYADSLARADQWVGMEHLYLNLASSRTEDLVDPPDVLARIAKELIQSAAQKQADATAAMAMRLDAAVVARAWAQQTAWRKMRPDGWWRGVPPGWPW